MTPVETLSFDHGLSAAIYHDSDVEQPFTYDDAVRIVVLHRRYIDPSDGTCGRTPDEVAAWERDNAGDWFTIPLFLYDHGRTAYCVGRTNPFHCPWDSGRVGIIALRRADWGNGRVSDDRLTAYAENIAETYTAWANGDCYGFVLSDGTGRERDSCWGFITFEAVSEAAADAAALHSPRSLST